MSKDLTKKNSTTGKFLPYILILAILIGILSPVVDARAQTIDTTIQTSFKCADGTTQNTTCDLNGGFASATGTGTTPATPAAQDKSSEFQKQIGQNSCGFGITDDSTFYPGCFIQASYGVFYVIPAFMLWAAGQFFNVLISMTLYSNLTSSSTFVSNAWVAVRDISNIFFILILLYVSIETILGISHDSKKVIVQVILMALLINFSMFFTEIIIDGTNILALVFYNKVSVQPIDASGNPIVNYTTITGEKDVAGGLVTHFDATRLLDANFFNQIKQINPPGAPADPNQDQNQVPPSILIGITIVAGLIMGYAAYCFFTVGVLFMSRLIELWILIIFSPFAFMSSSLPALSHVEGIGWDEWLSRLLSVSLMAPIFMFFLYLIFMMVSANPFGSVLNTPNTSAIKTLLLIAIPALVILIILKKATAKAQKNAGELGTALVGAAKSAAGAATGLAIGAATGGASFALTKSVGGIAQNVANDDALRAKAAAGDKGAQRKLALANSVASKSFDLRQTGLGKFASSKTGMDFNKGVSAIGLGTDKFKGGRKAQEERKAEEGIKKRKSYELSPVAAQKQDERAAQYQAHMDQAKKESEERIKKGSVEKPFDAEKFKSDYEAGKNISLGGRTVKVEAGSVKNATGVNQERGRAYTQSLNKQNTQDAKEAMKGFWGEFRSGMADMVLTPGGIATTAALGIATGGIGLLAAPLIGGIAKGFKEPARALGRSAVKAKEGDGTFMKAFKNTVRPQATDSEVVAKIRKGEDPLKHALHEIAKHTGDHGGSGHASVASPKPHAEPAHAPATPPAGGGHAH